MFHHENLPVHAFLLKYEFTHSRVHGVCRARGESGHTTAGIHPCNIQPYEG